MNLRAIHKCIWFSRLYLVCCFVFLLVNLAWRTTNYMEYAVETKIGPCVPPRQPFPKLSLCFNLNTLMTNEIPEYFFERKPPRFLNKSSGELFSLVPSVKSMLKACRFKDASKDQLVQVSDGQECARLFSITRFRMQSYMCYMLDLKKTEYDFYLVTHSLVDPRFLYSVVINEPLNFGHSIFPLIHFEDRPSDDRIFTQEYIPPLNGNKSLILHYTLFNVKRLEAPYTTKCGPKSKVDCYYDCMDEFHQRINLSSSFGIVEDTPDWHHIRVADYSNENSRPIFEKIFRESIDKCSTLCTSEACQQELVITLASEPFESEDMAFDIETASSPILKLEYTVKLELVEYITQCLSLASIWIQFSFLSLFNWRPKLKSQKFKSAVDESIRLRHLACNVKQVILMFNSFLSQARFRRRPVNRMRPRATNDTSIRSLKLLSHSFNILIFSLFIYQLYKVIQFYAKYETTVLFDFDLNPKVRNYSSLIVCLRVTDLLKPNQIPERFEESNYKEILAMEDASLNHTLAELFERTLGYDIISGCRFRNWTNFFWKVQLYHGNHCHSMFEIKKFFYNRKICYRFTPRMQIPLQLHQSNVKLITINPGVLYSIILNPVVASFYKHYVILTDSDADPVYSMEYNARISGFERRMNLITNHHRIIRQLPKPYDTKCDRHFSMVQCLMCCYNESISMINRVAYNLLTSNAYPFKILTYTDLLNDSINLYWQQLEDKCHNRCQSERCEYSFSQTYAGNNLYRPEFDTEYVVGLTGYPTSITKSVPRSSLYSLYYQTFCCLSFWLGFSFIASNPVELYRTRQMQSLVRLMNQKLIAMKKFFSSIDLASGGKSSLTRHLTRGVVFKLSMAVFCLFACTCHVVYSLTLYLEYPTVIESSRSVETSTNFSMAICLDTMYLAGQFFKISEAEFLTWQSSVLSNVTVKQIFDFSPPADEILHGCGFWKLSEDINRSSCFVKATDRIYFHHSNLTICNSIFRVQKILMQSKLCYQIYPANPTNWNRNQMLNTIIGPKNLFMVGLPSNLLTQSYTVIVAPEDLTSSIPYISSIYIPRVIKSMEENVWYSVSYIKYVQSVLPSPYSDGGFNHMYLTRCLEKCIEGHFIKYNLTLYGHFDHPIESVKFMTTADRKNPMVNSLINSVSEGCRNDCLRYNRYYGSRINFEFTVTVINRGTKFRFKPKSGKVSYYYLQSTDNLVMFTIFKVAISFCDLVINVGSVISIWFGLSAIAINPFTRILTHLRPENSNLIDINSDLEKIKALLMAKKKQSPPEVQ